jgi:PAS domain S-box-containing protein
MNDLRARGPGRALRFVPGLLALMAIVAWYGWPGSPPLPAWAAAAAAALVAAQLLLHERALRHGLQQRLAALDQGAQSERQAFQQAVAETRRETRRAEQALSLSEERYALALRGASDGLWEWDPAADVLQASPRWLHMLGRDGAHCPPLQLADRYALMHPDDREAARQALQQHLDGGSDRFELAHRLMHADGRYRWVLSRATAVRHASGKAYRVVGLDTDISRIKRVEALVEAIAQGTDHTSGMPFFQSLVMHFARALHIECAFITECADRPATRARTLAFWAGEGFKPNFEYELAGTPCETVYREGVTCFHPEGVGRLFPRERGQEGYLGLPIFARDGGVIGHLAFLHPEPMPEDVLLESVYRIVTARAGAEIELTQALQRLAPAAA